MTAFTDAKLQKVAVEAKVTEAQIKWFIDNGVDSLERMATAASDEKEVRPLIIEPMVQSSAELCKTLGQQSAVKLFWHASRAAWENATSCVVSLHK